ncbi:uncharacterized protein [Macrobrachium rosenbergii]|uniref:uncharacterized protein n=1 Tax=Macrobrachium rosenbergii TaxID=79674 RepID=UPI0034D75099
MVQPPLHTFNIVLLNPALVTSKTFPGLCQVGGTAKSACTDAYIKGNKRLSPGVTNCPAAHRIDGNMYRAVILLPLAAFALGQNDFFEKYTFTKVMANCFGEEVYYNYLALVSAAQKECQQLPVSSLGSIGYPPFGHQPGYPHYIPPPTNNIGYGVPQAYPQYPQVPLNFPQYPSVPPTYQQHRPIPQGVPQYHYVKKRDSEASKASTPSAVTVPPPKKPFFDKYYLLDAVNKITASLSNYTCVLNQIGLIDEYLNLDVEHYVTQFQHAPISKELKKDLADGIYYCRDLTYCMPLDRLKSPLPLNLQRLLMAMKCEKEVRTDACFKEDIRKNIDDFDLSLFPKDDTQENKINRLAAIVMEADSLNELQVI